MAVGIADRTTVADDDHADAVACRPHVRTCHSIVTPLAYVPAARACVDAVEVTVPVEVHDPAPTTRCCTSYLVCPVAVSYTHLDVYKRQVQCQGRLRDRDHRGAPCFGIQAR